MSRFITFIMLLMIIIVFIVALIVKIKNNKKDIEKNKEEIKDIYDFLGKDKALIESKSNSEICEEINKIYNNKGHFGEYQVYKNIKENLVEKFYLINNIYLPKEDSFDDEMFTEIDSIIIHNKGIFIIEVKNLFGKIVGDINDKEWIQVIDENSERIFYNPIMQNRNHIKHFKQCIELKEYGLSDKDIYSIIVFGNDSKIEEINYKSENLKLTKISDVSYEINNIINKKNKVLSNFEINEIKSTLKKYTNVDSEIKEKHIQSILENK